MSLGVYLPLQSSGSFSRIGTKFVVEFTCEAIWSFGLLEDFLL